jgi:hypothetical protein
VNIVARYRSWQLGRAMRSGKAPHGRVDPVGDSTILAVTMPSDVTMRMRVIRSDGSVEDMGVVSTGSVNIPVETLDGLRRAAEEG